MPLYPSKKAKTTSDGANLNELLKGYYKSGSIGNTTPSSNTKARSSALALAFGKGGKKK
jgi:hypothetical protein